MPSPAERFVRWVETDTGGNVALTFVACALVVAGYALGRVRR